MLDLFENLLENLKEGREHIVHQRGIFLVVKFHLGKTSVILASALFAFYDEMSKTKTT